MQDSNPKMQRFVLIDLGHPMTESSINNIIHSLENILVLSVAFSRNVQETNLRFSVLNSNFAIIYPECWLPTKCDLIAKNLSSILKQSNERVTVQQFKNLLRSSLETILNELQKKYKKAEIINNQSKEQLIQIAVVTKKTAWVVADILKTVTNKTQKSPLSVENLKIVQILNETRVKTYEAFDKNPWIDCIFCLDNRRDIKGFLKGWLLNPQKQVRILVSRDANLELKCEVEDCLINPVDFCWKFHSFGYIQAKIGNLLIGTSTQIRNLEVINRLPVKGICPTLVFGTPRRIRATRSMKCQTNSNLFKELCRELYRTSEGLLAKSALSSEKSDLITFHFLTSDGDMILMNEVVPDELHLPKREEFSNNADLYQEECDATVIKHCLEKIQFLNEFKPEKFSSGIYKFLRFNSDRMEQTKNSFSPFGSSDNFFVKRSARKENPINPINSYHDNETAEKRHLENVHPALLSPEVVEKYRKINKNVFNLPELTNEFT